MRYDEDNLDKSPDSAAGGPHAEFTAMRAFNTIKVYNKQDGGHMYNKQDGGHMYNKQDGGHMNTNQVCRNVNVNVFS